MWTETKQNYDKHVERMENWKGIWRTPRSLMDSTVNPKVKTSKGEGIGVHSLVHNTSRVEGHVGAPRWD
jgi:hypothetical protein